jgi:putative endonuclease
MTNRSYTSLYTGVTGSLETRIWTHKFEPNGFVKRYRTSLLVYCEETDNIHLAIEWEKRIKNMHRSEKVALIESRNPSWHDLAANWYDEAIPWVASPPEDQTTVAPAPHQILNAQDDN